VVVLPEAGVDMEGLLSDEGRAPLHPTEEGWNQLRPARSESLSVETKANVHFLFSKQPDNKKNRVKTAGQTSSSSFHFSGTGKMIK